MQLVFILSEACFGDVPVMFPRMKEINNLGSSIKLFIRNIPYPGGAVSDHTNFLRPVNAAPHCLLINPSAKKFRRFDCRGKITPVNTICSYVPTFLSQTRRTS
jgi:hypothetical protein